MTRNWVMVCHGVAYFGGQDHMIGKYLKAFDPDMHDGRGWTEWTSDPRYARRFNSAAEVFEFWRTISKVRPVRPDGQPNRPLTAYHIEPRQLTEEAA